MHTQHMCCLYRLNHLRSTSVLVNDIWTSALIVLQIFILAVSRIYIYFRDVYCMCSHFLLTGLQLLHFRNTGCAVYGYERSDCSAHPQWAHRVHHHYVGAIEKPELATTLDTGAIYSMPLYSVH